MESPGDAPWLGLDLAPEALWAKVMAASEIELRELQTRLQPGVRFDAVAFAAGAAQFRWQMAYDAVTAGHGTDAADALAMLADRMVSVWRDHPDLQAAMIACLQNGTDTAEILAQVAKAAGLPITLFPTSGA